MEQALNALRVDYEKKMVETVEKMRKKERDSYSLLVGEERTRAAGRKG